MSALSDALNKANVNHWSTRDIARKSGVNHATVAKYLNGQHAAVPSEQTLSALGEVFGIPLPRMRELASVPRGEDAPYEPPAESSRLSVRQRRAVDEVIRLLAEKREQEEVTAPPLHVAAKRSSRQRSRGDKA